jgi:hypothetical protein
MKLPLIDFGSRPLGRPCIWLWQSNSSSSPFDQSTTKQFRQSRYARSQGQQQATRGSEEPDERVGEMRNLEKNIIQIDGV